MEYLYFWTLSAIIGGTLVHGLAKTERFYEYPYFMAAAVTVFIMPQAVSLLRFPGAARPEEIEAVLLMTLLCLGCCLVAYRLPANSFILAHASVPVLSDRLLRGGIVFILCGFFFDFLILQMTPEESG